MSAAVKFSTYRPEIDGLRAIAVLAVVFYHFQVFGLKGGFTGVDVFFVLSGYLIGGLLWQETAKGQFSLKTFWQRRIRRLAPAYLVMVLSVMAFGWWVLLPFDLRQLGREGVAATVWMANILFWRGAGYFDSGDEVKPLLHMWSLSVEEQFYILLPVLVWLFLRHRGGLIWTLALCWGLSLAGNLWMTSFSQSSAFFLFPFRAWEMLTGVLLAILQIERPRARLPSGVAWLGLLGVICGFVWIPAGGAFPGGLALVPVLGTALVLASRPSGLWARALSCRPLVFVGLISYSLYLWHWPVWVFGGYIFDLSSLWARLAGILLAFVLAVACWAGVERPIRFASGLRPIWLLSGFVLASAVVVALSFWLWRSEGAAWRFPEGATLVHIRASQDFVQDDSRCAFEAKGPLAGLHRCLIGPDGPPKVVVWGDSHLRAMMEGLALAAMDSQISGVILWHAGCPPLVGVTKRESAATPAQDQACTDQTQKRIAAIKALSPDILLLVGRWSYYAEGHGLGVDAQNRIELQGDYAQAWSQTVTEFAPFVGRIAVLRQVPEIQDYDARQIARGLVHGRLSSDQALQRTQVPREAAIARMQRAEAPILAMGDGLIFLDPWPLLCTPDCHALKGASGLYFDNNHLTNTGARYLAPLFWPLFGKGVP